MMHCLAVSALTCFMFCGQLVAEYICYWPLAVPARAMPVFENRESRAQALSHADAGTRAREKS